jgi:hypothetical protein
MTMSVLERLTQIQNGWTTAMFIGIGFLLFIIIVVGIPLTCIIKNNRTLDKVFTVLTIICVICTVEILGSLAGLLISGSKVDRTTYYAGTYDIERMADDYNARIIEDDRQRNSYLVHYEGYGTEEWVYYVGKTDPQAQYLIQGS